MSLPTINSDTLFPGLYVLTRQSPLLAEQTTVIGVYGSRSMAQHASAPGDKIHGPFQLMDTASIPLRQPPKLDNIPFLPFISPPRSQYYDDFPEVSREDAYRQA